MQRPIARGRGADSGDGRGADSGDGRGADSRDGRGADSGDGQPGPAAPVGSAAVSLAEFDVPTAQQMRALGARLAALLRAGDLVVLTGPLGAGKTTLAQGIGAGMSVRGPVTSPTFVIARVHPALRGGPALVHADAYRLGSRAEVDDLDLDADADSSVTVVEWGEGLVEDLAPGYLTATLRLAGVPGDETRTVTITGHGERWASAAQQARRLLADPATS
jgi:tRNA threonylcarbamoyladenosine biosynthesis protein TsaE